MTAIRKFITDLGKEMVSDSGKITIPRYGMWSNENHHKERVIETSNDLDYLLFKYGKNIPVFKMKKGIR